MLFVIVQHKSSLYFYLNVDFFKGYKACNQYLTKFKLIR